MNVRGRAPSGAADGSVVAVLEPGIPLCVDLDGTLVKSDTLLDSIMVFIRQRPRDVLRMLGWIAQGKAAFKQHVTSAVSLDVEHLPYNRPLLAWLREEAATGRSIYLATTADRVLAERVAAHLGLFQGVLADEGAKNVAGSNNLTRFRESFGKQFCYIGNARSDAALLQVCVSPMVANPDRALRNAMARNGTVPASRFDDLAPALESWLKAARLHQWAKNMLIFVPVLLAHTWHLPKLVAAVLAFLSFGLCASSTYIINDLLDIETDRRHPRKSRRPFAAGNLSALAGAVAAVLLFASAAALALLLPRLVELVHGGGEPMSGSYGFAWWLLLYTVTTLTYSFYLKRKLLLDVFVLSGLYTVRILAGGAAAGLALSPWLAGFSVFFFLSLAFVKRVSELESLRERGGTVSNGRGYLISDLEQLRTLGTGAAYAAVVVMTLYINSSDTPGLYHHTSRLWLVVPVLLLWLSYIWMLTSRGEMHDDPVVWAITNKRSLLLGVLMAAVIWWAL